MAAAESRMPGLFERLHEQLGGGSWLSYETPAAADPIGESRPGARPGRLMRREFGAGEEA